MTEPKPDIEPVATLVERLQTDAAWCDTRVTSTIRLIGRDCAEAAYALLALEGERDRLVRILSYLVDTSIKERGWDFRHDPDTVEYVVKLLRGDEQ
jgi:hypothetical protein